MYTGILRYLWGGGRGDRRDVLGGDRGLCLFMGRSDNQKYRKIPRIRPPFDASKFMLKRGGGLIHEDLTFDKGVESQK